MGVGAEQADGLRQRPRLTPERLRAVTSSVNLSKGDKDPSNWLPPVNVCGYLSDWIAIKLRWGLSMDQSEAGRIRNVITDQCPDLTIAPWPEAPANDLPVETTVASPALALDRAELRSVVSDSVHPIAPAGPGLQGHPVPATSRCYHLTRTTSTAARRTGSAARAARRAGEHGVETLIAPHSEVA